MLATRRRAVAWSLVAALSVVAAGGRTEGQDDAAGPVDRAQAAATVVHRLVVPPTLDHPVTVFLGRRPLPAGSEVWPFDQPERRVVVERPAWFAWIDDEPEAFFAHPTRFVFIDVASGELTVVEAEWWPVVDGRSWWMSGVSRTDPDEIVYSELHRVPPGSEPGGAGGGR